MMLRGLQAGFGYPIGRETLAAIRDLGIDGVRLDCQGLPPETVRSLVDESKGEGLQVLVMVRDPAEIAECPSDLDLEVGNEPDLHGTSPADYAALVQTLHAAATPRGMRVWAPVVSNLNQRGMAYLREVVPLLPADVRISVHRYPHDTVRSAGATVPHDGFASRAAEVEALKAIIGDRPWGVSEFGYHTAPRPIKVFGIAIGSRRWTDDEVASAARCEWAFWDGMGASFAIWFQLNDGPEDVPEHRYGIRRVDGSWKPVAGTFRTFRPHRDRTT